MLRRLAYLLLLWAPVPAQAASLRLLTGEYYEGRLELAANGVNVIAGGGKPIFVEAGNIFSAAFRNPLPQTVNPGLVLTDGTVLGGAVKTLDGPAIAIGTPPINVPIDAVAWLVFAPAPREKLFAAGVPFRTGALLANGDFFPGTIAGLKDNRLEVNSVLFGPHKLELRRSVIAAHLHEVRMPETRFRISARRGDEFPTDNPAIDHAGITLHDAIAGDVKLKPEDVLEIHAGPARYRALAGFKPPAVNPPPGISAEDAFKVADPNGLNPTGASGMLLSAVNAQIAYPVASGFQTFACSVGVPADAPPDVRLVFAVYGDGRLLVRSAPRGPMDLPAGLVANLVGVKLLTLRVEPGGPVNAPVLGEWIEPIFTRP
jgi:hypothetical protein